MTNVGIEPPKGVGEILVLQYLRGFAAMAVVLYHVQLGVDHYNGASAHTTSRFGAAGVDLFFVISGFIMFYICAVKQPKPGHFLQSRLLRVVPLYWLATLAMFFMPWVSRTIGWSSTLHPGHLLTSLFFVGGVHWQGQIGDFPAYRAGWTINYEIFFYAVFAIGLFSRRVVLSAIIASALLAALVLVGLSGLASTGFARFYTAPILLEFVFGITAAYLYTRGRGLLTWLAWPAIAVGSVILYLVAEAPAQSFVRGLPATLILMGALSLEHRLHQRPIAVLKLLGDASYSIYLTHLFTLPVVEMAWHKFVPELDTGKATAFIVVGALASAVVGIACFYVVERPLHRWGRRLVTPRPATVPVMAATGPESQFRVP